MDNYNSRILTPYNTNRPETPILPAYLIFAG
jgi:hypothetical protein